MARLPLHVLAAIAAITAASACRAAPELAPALRRAAEADSLAREAIRVERDLNPARLSPTSVGILPLRVVTDDSSLASLGHGLAALLYTDLGRSARLTLVERQHTEAVLRELALGASGAVDSATAPRIGNLSGARRLVTGSVVVSTTGNTAGTRRGDSRGLQIETSIADVATGSVATGRDASTTLDQILDAEKALAFKLFDQLGVTLTPRERALVEQRPTRSLAALLAFSRGARAEAARDYATAARQYTRALRIDPSFAAARVQLTQVAPNPVAVEPTTAIQRVTATAAAAVNPPLAPVASSAADAPLQAVQQHVTITVRVGVP